MPDLFAETINFFENVIKKWHNIVRRFLICPLIENHMDYKRTLDNNIIKFFRNLISISFTLPNYLPFTLKTLLSQVKGIRQRRYWKKRGLEVPPVLIASITNRCNLKCSGCYNSQRENTSGNDMEREIFLKILYEATEIGSRIVFISGGEPMTRQDILGTTIDFPEILFPLFTNGILINEKHASAWKKQKNIIPILSLEGGNIETDYRRGNGVYEKVKKAAQILNKSGILFGHSMTATVENFELLTELSFIRDLYNNGARVFIFVEYQPFDDSKSFTPLNQNDKTAFLERVESLRKSLPGIFIEFPGEEEQYGGCLSAGRGFIHISADGSLEPCPFSPFSDSNLKKSSLKDALRSVFLRRIRESHEKLSEVSGCALIEKREWVKSLL